jgi:UDP-N-acetylmuramoylalanine--D-glutamate ligase
LDHHHAAVLGWFVFFKTTLKINNLTMKSLVHQNVMIIGLGISGLAMARWCVRYGATVTVVDSRANPPKLNQFKTELPDAHFVCSQFHPTLLDDVQIDYLLISPGIKPADINDLISSAKVKAIRIGNELTLFCMALIDLKESEFYKSHVLAITGTNGKTTVTSLTGKLVACANMTVAVAGNIGPSLLDTLSEKIKNAELPQVWVLELSSFQLNNVLDFEPTAGVVLNVTQDHLDWHGTVDSYIKAKSNVYGQQGMMVINRDDAVVTDMLVKAKNNNKNRKYCTFGSDLPSRLGDYGLESVNGMTWLVRAISFDDIVIKKQRSLIEPVIELSMQRLIPMDALQLRGQHNMLNALAALSLVESIGCSISRVLYGLRDYKGESHRVESIGIFNGVEYFDDSKGTNVGATVAAISGLGIERKMVVILGGDGKGQDFSPLIEVVSKFVRAIVFIGKDKTIIADVLKQVDIPKTYVDSMQQAVLAAEKFAQQGDAVLLSPACASLDMYDNYEHRGKEFSKEVLVLVAKGAQNLEEGASL